LIKVASQSGETFAILPERNNCSSAPMIRFQKKLGEALELQGKTKN
jgi:hypothetical protein